jgi:RNA-dependent RNA polymerase
MILEDLGVRKDTFVDLQDKAIAEARTINDSIVQFHSILRWHGLGNGYRLSSLLKRIESLGLDLITRRRTPGIDNPFLRQLRQVAMTSVLRDIKHNARIPIPNSYLLVGVADEGPAYRESGHENVFTLPEGHIYGAYICHPLVSASFDAAGSLHPKHRRLRTDLAERHLFDIKESRCTPWRW